MNEKYWTILEDTILRIIDERRIDCGIKKIGYNMKNRVSWRWHDEKSIASWRGKF